MLLTYVARGPSQKYLKMQHPGLRAPWAGEGKTGRADSSQPTHGSSVSFTGDKMPLVTVSRTFIGCVNLPLSALSGDLRGKLKEVGGSVLSSGTPNGRESAPGPWCPRAS